MRRGTHPRSAAAWPLAVAAALLFGPGARAADWLPYWPWSWATPSDPKLAAVVAAVRAEEVKYRDVEYTVRITVRDIQRRDPSTPSDITTMARRRVVFQGDRTYFRREAFERVGATRFRHEEVSAYDGERTHTVVGDNCANIHLGRWRHPQLAPVHALSLDHMGVNFPLSIYLAGTRAIHAELGYPPGLVDALPWQTLRKVEASLVGEEIVDGLRYVKVRADRWHYNNQPPFVQHLWLAPERNYLCIKEEHPYGVQRQEMRVHELREVAPGLWFPARISVVVSQPNGPDPAKPLIVSRTETVLDEVRLAPHHDDAFFRDVAIPAGLPVYTIQDRRLVGSMLPEPFDDERGKQDLAALAARVAAQERRYEDLEIRLRILTRFPPTSSSMQNVRYDQLSEERSIQCGGLAFSSAQQKTALSGGWQETITRVGAYDSEWTRNSWIQGPRDNRQGTGASLLRGRGAGVNRGIAAGVAVHRFHTMMLRVNTGTGSLADLLTGNPQLPAGRLRYEFRFCGAAEVDGRPCIEVRGDLIRQPNNRTSSVVLYLAADRNDLPIKVFTFDILALTVQGWILVNARRDTTVESVTSATRVPDAVFRDVRVPAGSLVQVVDESGQFVAQVQQAEEGTPWLPLKRFLELMSQAPANPQVQLLRRRAIDATIGRPVPDFPPGATWHGGKPPSGEALRGKVVILAFWAEWSEACRDELTQLDRFRRDEPKEDLAVIGVHPPGSEPAEVVRAIDVMKLGFPVCVDGTGAGGSNAWGEFAGRLAVRSVPHYVVVDREGKVAASGSLEDVLSKARALIQKGR